MTLTSETAVAPTAAPLGETFTEQLARVSRPIWEPQYRHPFVAALGDGTLPRANFEFYIRQDALYLDALTKMFAYATTRSADQEEMEHFGELLLNTIRVERLLHRNYGAQFGLTPEEMAATPLAPTNYAYITHMFHIGTTGTLAEIVSAVLPCAWIYAEVGHIYGVAGPVPETHPYRDWLGVYAAPDFLALGDWLRATLNQHTAGLPPRALARIEEIFLISSRYEYLFWEMAWRMETWPV